MKKKEDKIKDLEALRQDLQASRNLFVTGYEKLRVAQDFELRKVIRAAGGKYRVIKNNIAEKASEGTAAEDILKNLRGMTSLAYTTADPVALILCRRHRRHHRQEHHVPLVTLKCIGVAADNATLLHLLDAYSVHQESVD